MGMSNKPKWIQYNIWDTRGPCFVLITDQDWWDNNLAQIQYWFWKNCPNCIPAKLDNFILFDNDKQFNLWKNSWK
jgi:hypothetical protein